MLYPEVSYPSYEQGAIFSGCRAVAVPVDDQWRIDLTAIDPMTPPEHCACGSTHPEIRRAVSTISLLPRLRSRTRRHRALRRVLHRIHLGGAPQSILQHGTDNVLALHSLSKRSNLAGGRAGFYAGDTDLVQYLREVRKHGGLMVPGPVQAAAVAAFDDQQHVDVQREIYRERLELGLALLRAAGADVELPGGGFYLWAAALAVMPGRSPERSPSEPV